jgi:hypothetical protein
MRQTQLTEAGRRGGVDFSTSLCALMLRSIAQQCVSKHVAPPSFETPQDEDMVFHSRDALRTRVFFQAYGKTPTVERNGAPGGARVVGHATRTSVTTRSRFGRGARHRLARLREPPASGALRLPALHRQQYESFRPSDWPWPAANL